MSTFQLYHRQVLNISKQEAWAFLSSPHNLNTITPKFFSITVKSKLPDRIYRGLMVIYAMKAVFGIPMEWVSKISQCDQPNYFIYEQQVGPFKFWTHEVRLTEQNAQTVLEDIVFYAMPFGIVGDFFHKLLIADRLAKIFETRREYLTNLWSQTS